MLSEFYYQYETAILHSLWIINWKASGQWWLYSFLFGFHLIYAVHFL